MNVSACPPRRPDEAATRLTLRLNREKVTGTCFPSAPVPFLPPGCYFPDSDWFVDCCSYFLDFRSRNENWKKHVWIRSEPVQWFWVTLFNLLASASITAASSGLSAPGGHSCFALPVRPAYHEHQHQQQEGQVLHSTRLTRYRTEEGGWRLFLFLSEQAVEVHEVRTVWMMSAAAVFSSLSTTNYERY